MTATMVVTTIWEASSRSIATPARAQVSRTARMRPHITGIITCSTARRASGSEAASRINAPITRTESGGVPRLELGDDHGGGGKLGWVGAVSPVAVRGD